MVGTTLTPIGKVAAATDTINAGASTAVTVTGMNDAGGLAVDVAQNTPVLLAAPTDVNIVLSANVAAYAALAITSGTAVTVTKLDGTDGLETTVAVGDVIANSKTLTIAEAPCPAPPASGASSVSATAFSLVAVLAAAAGFMLA